MKLEKSLRLMKSLVIFEWISRALQTHFQYLLLLFDALTVKTYLFIRIQISR